MAVALEPDRVLFSEFMEVLPTAGAVRLLRDRGLPPYWRQEWIEPLYRFAEDWHDAEREFLDPELETVRSDLLAGVDELLNYIGWNTFVVLGDRQGIPPEWEYEQLDRALEVTNELVRLGDGVVQAHQTLIRLARRRLAL